MTLHEAVIRFRLSPIHDFQRHDERDGKYIALYGLGLYEADLKSLRSFVPNLAITEHHRVRHDCGTWLRVDVVEEP